MDLLPNGARLRARATMWKLGEASTGTVMVAVDLEVTAPDGTKVLRTWFGFFTDASAETTFKALRALGWKGVDISELETPHADLNANEVEVEIEHEEYPKGSGRIRDRVRWVNSLGGGGGLMAPLTPVKKAELSNRMKATFLQLEQSLGGGGRPAPKPAPASSSSGPNDIPF